MGNIHGIPFENTTRACGPGVLNCYKITASKETVQLYSQSGTFHTLILTNNVGDFQIDPLLNICSAPPLF